jgi:hypothetical protein
VGLAQVVSIEEPELLIRRFQITYRTGMTISVRMVELTMPPIMKSNRQANGAYKDQEISGMGKLYSMALANMTRTIPSYGSIFLRIPISTFTI